MKNVSVKMDDETVSELDSEADELGLSRAEYIRTLVESRHDSDEAQAELDEIRAEYESEIEDLERENERLQRERRQILDQREEHTELVTAVQEEQSLAKKRAGAGVGTRLYWWAFGMDEE